MSKVDRLRRLTKLSLLRVLRAATPLHITEALDDISEFGDEFADELPANVLAAIMGVNSASLFEDSLTLDGYRFESAAMLRRVDLSLSMEMSEVDESGTQRHLRIPVNARGEGPSEPHDAVSLVCWCARQASCSVLPVQEIARQ